MDAQFATILQRLKGQDKTLDKILDQTTKTNGRVNALENKMQGRWKYLMGGSAGVTVCAVIIWELFKFFFGK